MRKKKSACENFQEWKSAPSKFLEQNQFHDEKNKSTSFTKRINQHATSFMNKICMLQILRIKISTQQVPWTELVSRGEKLIYKFAEKKNNHLTSLTKKL